MVTRKTTVRQKIALIGGSIIVTVIFLELGLRLAGFVVLSLRDRANRIDRENKEAYRIICIGESTTYDGDHTYAYPNQLQALLAEKFPAKSFTVINKGKPGCSTAYIADNLEGWVDDYRPDMVVAMMGINDTSVSYRLHEKTSSLGEFIEGFRVYKLAALLGQNIEIALEKFGRASPNRLDPDLYQYRGLTGPEYDLFQLEAELGAELQKHPDDPAALVRMGDCYLSQDRYQEATEIFEKAIKLDPMCDEAYVGLARGYLNKQYHKGVTRACWKAIEINPGNDRAWTLLGRSFLSKKKYGQAMESFSQAIEINPANDRALASLAWIDFWKNKEIARGKERARRALEINPDNYLATVTLWSCYEAEGDYRSAIGVCENAIERDPYHKRAYVELAYIYRQLGEPEKAEQYLRQDRRRLMNTYNPITFASYQRITKIVDCRGIQLVAVQYPMRPVGSLEKMLEDHDDIIFVDNEDVFKEALRNADYDDLFKDAFAGDFGHCTPEGNRILAENVAATVIEEYLKPTGVPRD